VSIRVTVSGADRSPLRRFNFPAEASRWAAVVGPAVHDALRREAPVAPVKGGRLRDSVRFERHIGTGSAQLVFTADTPYTRYVLEGTAAHIIRPRTARALRFQHGGQTRFARLVQHPGTRANPFPTRAIKPLLPLIQQRFSQIVSASLRG
jgi:hypothetical protein